MLVWIGIYVETGLAVFTDSAAAGSKPLYHRTIIRVGSKTEYTNFS